MDAGASSARPPLALGASRAGNAMSAPSGALKPGDVMPAGGLLGALLMTGADGGAAGLPGQRSRRASTSSTASDGSRTMSVGGSGGLYGGLFAALTPRGGGGGGDGASFAPTAALLGATTASSSSSSSSSAAVATPLPGSPAVAFDVEVEDGAAAPAVMGTSTAAAAPAAMDDDPELAGALDRSMTDADGAGDTPAAAPAATATVAATMLLPPMPATPALLPDSPLTDVASPAAHDATPTAARLARAAGAAVAAAAPRAPQDTGADSGALLAALRSSSAVGGGSDGAAAAMAATLPALAPSPASSSLPPTPDAAAPIGGGAPDTPPMLLQMLSPAPAANAAALQQQQQRRLAAARSSAAASAAAAAAATSPTGAIGGSPSSAASPSATGGGGFLGRLRALLPSSPGGNGRRSRSGTHTSTPGDGGGSGVSPAAPPQPAVPGTVARAGAAPGTTMKQPLLPGSGGGSGSGSGGGGRLSPKRLLSRLLSKRNISTLAFADSPSGPPVAAASLVSPGGRAAVTPAVSSPLTLSAWRDGAVSPAAVAPRRLVIDNDAFPLDCAGDGTVASPFSDGGADVDAVPSSLPHTLHEEAEGGPLPALPPITSAVIVDTEAVGGFTDRHTVYHLCVTVAGSRPAGAARRYREFRALHAAVAAMPLPPRWARALARYRFPPKVLLRPTRPAVVRERVKGLAAFLGLVTAAAADVPAVHDALAAFLGV